MYKLSEEEYYKINDAYEFQFPDYHSWYMSLNSPVSMRIGINSNNEEYNKYLKDLIEAESKKEQETKLELLQEALDT